MKLKFDPENFGAITVDTYKPNKGALLRHFALMVTGHVFEISEKEHRRVLGKLRNDGLIRDDSADCNFFKPHVVAVFNENSVPAGVTLPPVPESSMKSGKEPRRFSDGYRPVPPPQTFESEDEEPKAGVPSEPECPHTNTEPRKKAGGSGRMFYYEQCMDCKTNVKRIAAPLTHEEREAILPVLE